MNTGEYILNFFAKFIGTPAILIGLFAFVGCLLQKKKFTETISSTIKVTIGFLIIGGGAGIISGAVAKLGNAFNLLFGVSGVISNNDVIPSLFLQHIPNIALAGSLIMISAMFLNIVLARITQYKYIYLTGHVLFYLSIMFASVLYCAGLDAAKDMPTIVISGALLVSLWMIISPAMLNKHVAKITKNDALAVGHTGSISYLTSAWIGNLIGRIAKKPVKSTEDINFPKGLSFLRNTNIAIALTMFMIYLVIYFSAWGVHGYEALVVKNIIANGDDVFVQGLLQAFTFAAGVEVLLIGVRMFIAEIVPSFQGISQKLVPNAKPALDCPTIFPYAPNAVLIGFVSSFIGGIIGMAATIAIVSAIGPQNKAIIGWAIIIPSIVPHFFVGASAGVFGNARGGILGAIIGPFINGLLISFVPFIFFGLQYMPSFKDSSSALIPLTWGDSDFLLGLPFAILVKGVGRNTALWLLPVVALILWSILPIINLGTKLKNKEKIFVFKSNSNLVITTNDNLAVTTDNNVVRDDRNKGKNLDFNQTNKLVAVCGQGLGSSLLIEINIKKIIEELNIPEIEVDHTNINSFNNTDEKILAVICGADLSDSINFDRKIVLNNLLDQEELKAKLLEFLR